MRAIVLILILLVVAAIGAVASGWLDISQTRPAAVPEVTATDDGIRATGGQAPRFDVETGSVQIGARQTNVTVPTVQVTPPDGQQARQPPPAPAIPPAAPATTNATN